jgi:hypothetical protein
MAIRLDREWYAQVTAEMEAGNLQSSASGARIYDDGSRSEPGQEPPWGGKSQALSSTALRYMSVPSDVIAAIRPPVPIALFPPEDISYEHHPVTIEDVLDLDRWSSQPAGWVSPNVRMTSRRGEETGVGSLRNVNSTISPFS